MIDWHRLEITLAGAACSALAFMHEQLTTFLQIEIKIPYMSTIATMLGIIATVAVIWMNVETALLKRKERKKLGK